MSYTVTFKKTFTVIEQDDEATALDDAAHKLALELINRMCPLDDFFETSVQKEPVKEIIPVRIDSYAGNITALEVHKFEDKEEYAAKSIPANSMWIAVYMIDGRVKYGLTDYGYESFEELLETYKNERIVGV